MADAIHVFTESGLGAPPFRVVGIWQSPPRSLQAANPQAYANAMRESPVPRPGACAHCSTGITNHFVIESSDGRRSAVGSDCVGKSGDKGLVSAVKRLQSERRRKLAREKRELQWQQKQDEQRERNGGLTDYELSQQRAAAHRAAMAEAVETAGGRLLSDLQDIQDRNPSRFLESIIHDLTNYAQLPSPRGQQIVIDIVSKHRSGAPRNSQSYSEAEAETLTELQAIERAIESARHNEIPSATPSENSFSAAPGL